MEAIRISDHYVYPGTLSRSTEIVSPPCGTRPFSVIQKICWMGFSMTRKIIELSSGNFRYIPINKYHGSSNRGSGHEANHRRMYWTFG